MKGKLGLFVSSTIILVSLFFIGIKVYEKQQDENLSFLTKSENKIFARDYSPRWGNPEAKVVITEFLDPECETCREFFPLVKKIIKENNGKVQLVVRYAPFHGNSKIAVRALEAARLQGKYWQAIEMLYHYQPEWGDHHNPRIELIYGYLEKLGLDMEKLRADMNSPAIEKMLEQDMTDLRQLGVKYTPSFFVNGKALRNFGIMPLLELVETEIIDKY